MSLPMDHALEGIAHGYCLLWNPALLWLHAGSDSVIAAAYFVIPFALLRFIRARRDVQFNSVFLCFGAFILLCGATHVLDVYNIWVPNWWLSGGVKAATAVVSVATAGLLLVLLPQAIALPSPSQLRSANDQLATANALLRAEATEREAVTAALARAHEGAEDLVRIRTSELAKSNARLERSEARYRALVQSSTDSVWTTAPDGEPTDVTQWSSFVGLSDASLSFGERNIVHLDDRARVMEQWSMSLATEAPYDSQHRLALPDGTWRHVRVKAVPVRDASGHVREWVGSHLDISAQVESTRQLAVLQEQLQQSQRLEAVGRLAGGVAHDFNNLLTVITGAGSLVLDELPRDHPSRRDIEDVVAAGTRAAALTAQLLAYSRKQVLQPHLLDLNVILVDVQAMLRRLIGEQIHIDLITRADRWAVRADPSQLEQVILNLALNARDAMPSGGTITFETAQVSVGTEYSSAHVGVTPGEYVMLAVSDTGTGMDEVTRSQIFEPFFTTKAVGAGTGLGLATVYGIVRQSGGHIYVYSEPGLGTTFKIYLPRAEGTAPGNVPTARDAPRQTGEGQTILLVEDATDVREFVARVLSRAGYVVIKTDGPDTALIEIDRDGHRIDMLLTDVIMPGMNGRELADLVVQRRPGIAVLFMSGYTDNAIAHHGVLDPATHFLHKPFSPDQLLHEVRRALTQQVSAPRP